MAEKIFYLNGEISCPDVADFMHDVQMKFVCKRIDDKDTRKRYYAKTRAYGVEEYYYKRDGTINPLLPKSDEDSIVRKLAKEVDDNNLFDYLKRENEEKLRIFIADSCLMKDNSVRLITRVYNVSLLRDALEGFLNPSFATEKREFEIKNLQESAGDDFYESWVRYLEEAIVRGQKRLNEK